MKVQIEARPGDIQSLHGALSPDVWAPPVADLLKSASDVALREAQSGAAGLGAVASSLHATAHPLDAAVSSDLPEAIAAEFGRRAGARMPPVGALVRYGGDAYAIARTIARRGIKGRFFLRKAYEVLDRSELDRLIETAQRAIGARWERP